MSTFQPKRSDGRPGWRVVDDYIKSVNPAIGEVLSHDDLRGTLEHDEQKHYYAIIGTVCRHMEREDKRTLRSVRGVGYEFTAGAGQIEKGRHKRRGATRTLGRAARTMVNADFAIMSPADRSWADRERNALVALVTIVKQHDEKIVEIADELRVVQESTMRSHLRQESSEERIAELERARAADQARIEELERKLREPKP